MCSKKKANHINKFGSCKLLLIHYNFGQQNRENLFLLVRSPAEDEAGDQL